MNDALTIDEYDALSQILRGPQGARPSACVARNTKRLAGLKYIAYGKNGNLTLTEKGQQTLFVKKCIDGLRAISANPGAALEAEVTSFLIKKGHVAPGTDAGTLQITDKGRESLADINANAA